MTLRTTFPRVLATSASALLVACACGAAAAQGPSFGPSNYVGQDTLTESPLSNGGDPFREHVQRIHDLLVNGSVDPRAARTSIREEEKPKVRKDEPHGFQFYGGLHLRRIGTSEQVFGAGAPTDTLLGALPGLLIVGRVGVQWEAFSAYVVAGTGGYRMIRYDVSAQEAVSPLSPSDLVWSGVVMQGVGGEIRFDDTLSIGVEYDVSMLTAQPGTNELLWPLPGDAIRTLIGGVRVEY